ncbi:MAG: hypothetical protein WB952_08115 [Terriglobales bacterium]
MTFVDEYGRPLLGGTALQDPCTLHEGIVAYDARTGQQVMLHNSKQIGRSAMTLPEAFTTGGCQTVRTRVPQSPADAEAVVQSAWSDVQSGRPWAWFDNCQDFVNRAYTGQDGSHTRTLVAVGILMAVVVMFAVNARNS